MLPYPHFLFRQKVPKNLSDDVFAYFVRPNAGCGRLSRVCKQTGPSAGRF